MKIYRNTLIALCCVLIGMTASAQVPSAIPAPPPLPPGPLIQKRAPNFAQWVITTVSTPASKANSESTSTADASATDGAQNADNKTKVALEVTMTKTGKFMLREVRAQDRPVVPTWCVSGLQITISDGISIVQAKINDPDPAVYTPDYEDYSDSDFQGFDWIKTSNYTGIKQIGGRKCIVFQDTLKNRWGGVNVVAHVDLETRLPVDVSLGGGTRTYTFKAPPTSELVLPPSVIQLLKNRQRTMDSATPRSQRQ